MSGPLSATDAARLAGPSTLDRFISFTTAKKIASALINQATFIYPLAQLTVDTTSGWSAVRRGMRAGIGSAAEGSDIAILNTRKTPGATTLYTNEVSEGDRGAIPRAFTNAFLLDNLHVTIWQMFDYWTALPRVVSGTHFENYDEAYADFNHLPPPYTEEITFNGYPGHYNTFVDAGQTYATIVLVATDALWITSSSIASRQWTLPASWTVTGGSLTSATVTARAPVLGKEPYLVIYEATDNNGKTSLPSYRLVWVYDESSNYPIYVPLSEIGSDTRDLSHRRMQFTLNGTALSQIPEGAFCVYWERPTWNGLDVATATRSFAGWLLRHDEQSEPGLATARPELVGPLGISRNAPAHYFETTSGTPANWNQIVNTVGYVDFLLRWIVERRAPIIAQMFGYHRMGISNLSGKRTKWKLPRGTIFSQMRSIASRYYKANVGSDSTGSIWVRRHPSTWPPTFRTSVIPIRVHLHAGLIKNLSAPRTLEHKIATMTIEGYESDGVTDTLRRSQAPESPAQGGSEMSEADLIFESQAEANVISGHLRAMQDNPYGGNSFLIERNYDAFEPVRMEAISLAVPPGTRPDSAVWPPVGSTEVHLTVAISSTSATTITTVAPLQTGMVIKVDDEYMLVTATAANDSTVERGYLDSTAATHLINTTVYRTLYLFPSTITKAHLPGTANIGVSGPLETAGFPGIALDVPTANENVYGSYIPEAPPVLGIENATHDGNTWIVQTDSKIAITVNTGVNYINITGTGLSGTFWSLILDPFSDFLGAGQAGNLGAWLLSTTGLYYTQNILTTSPSWTLKNALSPGVVNTVPLGTIRASTTTQGRVYVAWADNGGSRQVRAARLDNYGLTAGWTYTESDWNDAGVAPGMDIDHYGSDEMLVGVRDAGLSVQTIYRIIGGAATHLTGADTPSADGRAVSFIQKPLFRFGGGENSNTGATEDFIWFAGVANLDYTTDGATTVTDITPGAWTTGAVAPNSISSIVATDDGDVIAFIIPAGTLFTTTTRGSSWNSYGPDAAGMGLTIGFFPRLIAGQYALYMAGASNVTLSPDFGVTRNNVTGDLHTIIGGSPTFISSVIPLY
jgi:hypothetical protein